MYQHVRGVIYLNEANVRFEWKEKLKEMTKYTQEFTKPTYIFEVKHTDEKNRKFESIIEATRVSMGITESSQSLTSLSYHGTRMDNMYSILHNGLLSHLNKVVLVEK